MAFDLASVSRPPASASSQIVIGEKILAMIMSRILGHRPWQRSHRGSSARNILPKIPLSAPETHKQNRLESPGARSSLSQSPV